MVIAALLSGGKMILIVSLKNQGCRTHQSSSLSKILRWFYLWVISTAHFYQLFNLTIKSQNPRLFFCWTDTPVCREQRSDEEKKEEGKTLDVVLVEAVVITSWFKWLLYVALLLKGKLACSAETLINLIKCNDAEGCEQLCSTLSSWRGWRSVVSLFQHIISQLVCCIKNMISLWLTLQ